MFSPGRTASRRMWSPAPYFGVYRTNEDESGAGMTDGCGTRTAAEEGDDGCATVADDNVDDAEGDAATGCATDSTLHKAADWYQGELLSDTGDR